MKVINIFRKVFVLLLFFSGFSYLRAISLRKKNPLVRILLMHHVRPNKRKKFLQSIRVIHRHCNIISFNELIEGNFDLKRINVLLTFDDGYLSWYETIFPVFKKMELSGLFFINSGFIDTSKNTEESRVYCREQYLTSYEPPLNWNQIISMVAGGMTIGGHGINHIFLDTLEEKECLTEIRGDRERISSQTNISPSAFAYPFGVNNKYIRECIVKSGYKYAFTTESNFLEKDVDPLLLPRTNTGVMSPLLMMAYIWGSYDILCKFEDILRRFTRSYNTGNTIKTNLL